MLSEEFLDRVKAANPVEDVIRGYQSLSKRGANLWGICPFHADTHPSMSVSPSKQIFKCFVCGESGGAIKYVQKIECVGFAEAVKILADKAHIDMPDDPEETEEERAARIDRENLIRDNERRQKEYTSNPDQPELVEYLEKREISAEAAAEYGIGYSASDEFRGRVTYPFYSPSGVLVGWTARTLNPNDRAKYKNSAESILFHKDSILFGLRQAQRQMQKEHEVYIVEGQNDVIRMWMSGIVNTVAGSGTAFGEKQVRLLKRYCEKVILMYDGDNAGRAATLKSMKLLLQAGFDVNVCILPDGEDPDSWLLKLSKHKAQDTGYPVILGNHTKRWYDYLQQVYPVSEDPNEKTANLNHFTEMVALVPDDVYRSHLIRSTAIVYESEPADVRASVNKHKVSESDWKDGIYGAEEAEGKRKEQGNELTLTFSKDYFFKNMDAAPTILWIGGANQNTVQQLRGWENVTLRAKELVNANNEDMDDSVNLKVACAIHHDGIRTRVIAGSGEDQSIMGFTEWYLSQYEDDLQDTDLASDTRTDLVRKCIRVIADSDATVREVNGADFRKKLRLSMSSYNSLLKEILGTRKDRREAERKRTELSGRLAATNLYDVPEYVTQDEVMSKQYQMYGFFPLLANPDEDKEEQRPVAYVFKNEKGGGHTVVSDFYMEALLFVDPSTDHSKRVIRLYHMHGGQQFVEWPSDAFVSLQDMKKRLFSSGAYNFNGTPQQWDKIRQVLSYNFTDCFETRVFGWQPEGFMMLPNAVYYPDKDGKWHLDYTNNLGVAEVNNMRFYSPASSSIRLGGRQEDNPYEQDEYAFYKEPQAKDRMELTDWAKLMDQVFQVNQNGKWAVLFAIACSFRDLIYSIVGSFTALCFAGPSGSGKTELAYGIRGLWMRRKAAVFNLNSGSDAAFFIFLEHFRNMPVIMEEYNDNGISQIKFQGLKSAVYDDKGRTKVKDIANKSLDTSKTNAAPILLGQDTPQQDDGSLSNRVIICEVPKKEDGFSQAETELFEKLKQQAELGMGNILCDIIRQRPIFERYFKRFFNEEVARMKADTWESTTNKDGLERVIRSIAILSATSRLVEEQCDIKLPWEHAHFYEMAVKKVSDQMENISTTSKIGNFFQSLNTQISTGRVIIGREIKIDESRENGIKIKEGSGEKSVEVGKGCKILYLHLESAYSAYCKEVTGKDALSRQTLVNYFRSHSAYIGLVKSTRFTWETADFETTESSSGAQIATRQMVKHSTVSSAYAFKYEVLAKLLDIDFERRIDDSGKEVADNPFT